MGLVRLQWLAEAGRAFGHLRALFTSAPVLAHPDPSLAFIVEVDASEAGIEAVLSQCSGTPPELWRGGPGAVGCRQGFEGVETLD